MAAAVGTIVLLSLCSVCTVLSADVSRVCPPYDASICIYVRPGAPQCHNDSQCPSSKICCCFNCGWQCVDPVKVKPGSCPNIKIKCDANKIEYKCDRDSDCLGAEKCCPFCGRKCWKPDPEPSGVCTASDGKELLCPSNKCRRGSDCGEAGKCCISADGQQCVTTAPDVSRVCPPYDASICIYAKPGAPQCHNDSQCPSSKICCCFNCGWQCVDPVKVKPGSCPDIKIKCDANKIEYKCDRDSDCLGAEKCCPFCGRKCWKPDPEPSGVCTASDGKELLCPSNKCRRGSDCGEAGKCCISADGQQCVTTAPDVSRVCPSYDASICVHVRPGAPQCHNDSQCPSSKICCCFNCGWQCVDPVKVKPGSCPNIKIKCDANKIEYKCDRDSDCLGADKCCPFCGRKCWKPDPEPAGVCATSDGKELLCPSNKCRRGSDCGEAGKCCISADGQQCVTTAPDL
ncbi:low-density lipoprotein receptor-related protein 2-like isoform X2 [Pseudophryne corroboree]|uniref:low-density lipoprotein receptor-related protein 2-like isoform X2 n=1 Tax=Pseudophryne corroboree TaxID=495146 RepID=UPI003081E1F4